jgi:hypothetical protein
MIKMGELGKFQLRILEPVFNKQDLQLSFFKRCTPLGAGIYQKVTWLKLPGRFSPLTMDLPNLSLLEVVMAQDKFKIKLTTQFD